MLSKKTFFSLDALQYIGQKKAELSLCKNCRFSLKLFVDKDERIVGEQ